MTQADRLRAAADQFEKAMRGRFDAINPSDLPPMMREAADTIEDLCNRLTRQTCHNVAQDREDLVCSMCGCYVENVEPDWSYCPSCGRMVV